MSKATLNRQRITGRALDLLDTHGIDGLSTRRLADTLNIKSASLYHHFRNKDELLDEMCDAMFRACLPPPLGKSEIANWREWLAEGARGIRAAALSRRDGASIMARSRMYSEAGAQHFAENLRSLKRLGLSTEDAIAIRQSLRSFAVGFALQEQNSAQHTRLSAAQQQEIFETGLRWFLDGIELQMKDQKH